MCLCRFGSNASQVQRKRALEAFDKELKGFAGVVPVERAFAGKATLNAAITSAHRALLELPEAGQVAGRLLDRAVGDSVHAFIANCDNLDADALTRL